DGARRAQLTDAADSRDRVREHRPRPRRPTWGSSFELALPQPTPARLARRARPAVGPVARVWDRRFRSGSARLVALASHRPKVLARRRRRSVELVAGRPRPTRRVSAPALAVLSPADP